MLRSLHIQNIAVIKQADIEFHNGFTVLTGETGAGKSVIIDGINMLTGAKVSRDIIRNGEDYALSEAIFDNVSPNIVAKLNDLGIDCSDNEIIITTKISNDGKSISRINGRSITKSLLKDISKNLISIHGQNDSQMLYDKASYVNMIDAYGECEALLGEYKEIYDKLEFYRKKLSAINSNEEEKIRRRDILEYQIRDIDSKKLKNGEEEYLESEKIKLSNIEKINKHVGFASRVLTGGERGNDIAYMISKAADSLNKVCDVVPDAGGLAEKLIEISYEISDIAESVQGLYADDENPTAKLDKIESRLEIISALKRRYGKDIKSILEFRERAVAELDEIEMSDECSEEYRKEIDRLEAEALTSAQNLSNKRQAAAYEASKKIMDVLSYLDMPKVKFTISFEKSKDFTANGFDEIDFMVATNPGEPLMPMVSIASGGEMARIMLALKSVLNENSGVQCSVYDEIDTGISGKTSRKIGVKLSESGRQDQIICVTHSAQIATLADNHYLIEKQENDGRAHTCIRRLNFDERIEEAARILGGINITESQRQAARDMLLKKDEDC